MTNSTQKTALNLGAPPNTASERDLFLYKLDQYKNFFNLLQDNMDDNGFAKGITDFDPKSFFAAANDDDAFIKTPNVMLKGRNESSPRGQRPSVFVSNNQREKLPALNSRNQEKSSMDARSISPKRLVIGRRQVDSGSPQRNQLSPLNRSVNDGRQKRPHRGNSLNPPTNMKTKPLRMVGVSPTPSSNNQHSYSILEPLNNRSSRDVPLPTTLTRLPLQVFLP